MKKNRMMRLASVLLVAVLMTTCTISGTFAKYVTSVEAEDIARVAKWGVKVTATGKTFAKAYNDEDDSAASTVVSSGYDAAGVEDVVAPGTAGNLAAVSISGKPEVDTVVTYDADLSLVGWTTDGSDVYCPIIFTVNDTDYSIWGTDIAGFEDLVEDAIEAEAKKYQANEDLSDANNDLTVSWRWEFEADLLAGYQTDVKDTALGDRAASGSAATITLTIVTAVTQVD